MTTRWQEEIRKLRERREKIKQMGDPRAIEERRAQGKLSARERIDKLLDPGTFVELDMFVSHHLTYFGLDKMEIPAEGVVAGFGEIKGRPVCVFSQDFTALEGTFSEMQGQKICKLYDLAMEAGVPVIGIYETKGVRLQEGLWPFRWLGELLYRMSKCSGLIPQIAVAMGNVEGELVFALGLSDFVFMTRDSIAYLGDPETVKEVSGIEVNDSQLGGASMHASTSGLCYYLARDEEECLGKVRELFDFISLNCFEKPPYVETGDDPERPVRGMEEVVLDDSKKPYDMHKVLREIFDNGRFFELRAQYSPNMIIGFAHLGGYSVGVVANQPLIMAGCIDVWAAEKASRFIRFCDAFNIPLIFIQDTPAYLPGTHQERLGMIYRGSTLLYASSEATVPKITLLARKAYAGAYIAMNSKYLRADQSYAWPIAEVANVAPETAGSVIFARQIRESPNPEETRQRLLKEYYDKFINPIHGAQLLHIDDIIEPEETRARLIKALRLLQNKRQELPEKKHGCMPL